MDEKVSINISARHVHLTKESIDKLFGHDLHVKKNLNQKGQFAAEEVVTIKCGDKKIENVRVVGPARSYNQVEISALDARSLGITPPVRRSGDLSGAEVISVETPKASITGAFAILADRHVHFSPEDAQKYGVKDGDFLMLYIGGTKPGVIEAHARVSEDGYFEAHLDTDDANAFLIKSGAVGVLRK